MNQPGNSSKKKNKKGLGVFFGCKFLGEKESCQYKLLQLADLLQIIHLTYLKNKLIYQTEIATNHYNLI